MQTPSKDEVLNYVAEIAEQLAAMCRGHDRFLSAVLIGAAMIARKRDQPEQTR